MYENSSKINEEVADVRDYDMEACMKIKTQDARDVDIDRIKLPDMCDIVFKSSVEEG